MNVTLLKPNLGHAAYIATLRHLKIFSRYGEKHPVMQKFDAIDHLVRICQSEMAVAKALGVPWDCRHFHGQEWLDGRGYSGNCSGMIVRPVIGNEPMLVTTNDPPLAPVLMVRTESKPDYTIVGWLWASEAGHFAVDRCNAKIHPQHLRPISSIPVPMLAARFPSVAFALAVQVAAHC